MIPRLFCTKICLEFSAFHGSFEERFYVCEGFYHTSCPGALSPPSPQMQQTSTGSALLFWNSFRLEGNKPSALRSLPYYYRK